jgi:hypothetical protein
MKVGIVIIILFIITQLWISSIQKERLTETLDILNKTNNLKCITK